MKIKYKKNGNFEVEFNEYFKKVDDLKDFIKEKNKFINVETLENEIHLIYNDLVLLDHSIKSSLLDWFIVGRFNFKYKRPNNLNFWLERGYGIHEFNNSVGGNISELELENIFKFNEFSFKHVGVPKCNLCGSNLMLEPSIDRYKIIGCENIECESYKNVEVNSIKQLAFLPIDLYLSKNKRIKVNSKVYKEYWLLNGYTYVETKIKIKEVKERLQEVNVNSFEYYKITTDMGDNEIYALVKQQSPLCVDFWVDNGLTLLEANKKISEMQIDNSNKLIKLRQENPENYTAITETQIGYWLNKGYSNDDAKLKLSERQTTFSLDTCIKKYGEIGGGEIFTERQNKWLTSLLTNGNMVIGYSKISQDLFNKILEKYDDKCDIYFATHNGEFKLNKESAGVWLYDFTDIKNKKIIEFNGDMYHGNPKKYKSGDYPHPFRKNITAQEMWDKDKRKNDLAISKGFEILVIWDSEYRWGNREEIINKCIKFLNK